MTLLLFQKKKDKKVIWVEMKIVNEDSKRKSFAFFSLFLTGLESLIYRLLGFGVYLENKIQQLKSIKNSRMQGIY